MVNNFFFLPFWGTMYRHKIQILKYYMYVIVLQYTCDTTWRTKKSSVNSTDKSPRKRAFETIIRAR